MGVLPLFRDADFRVVEAVQDVVHVAPPRKLHTGAEEVDALAVEERRPRSELHHLAIEFPPLRVEVGRELRLPRERLDLPAAEAHARRSEEHTSELQSR